MQKSIELLKQIVRIIDEVPSQYEEILKIKDDVVLMINKEIEIIRSLSEKWHDTYYLIMTELGKIEKTEIQRDELSDILHKVIVKMQEICDTSDYYIALDTSDFTWQVPNIQRIRQSNKFILLDDEFERIWSKIVAGENFTLMRSGDGERAIMTGKSVTAQENWKSPEYVTELGKALYDSHQIVDDKVYYAISCPCCDPLAYFWYLNNVKNVKNTTFANIWCNINYPAFRQRFETLQRDVVLIANYRAEGKKIANLNILKHYSVSDDCISFWENDAKEMVRKVIEDFGNKNDLLYVVSAGPMSGPIIAELFRNNPNNCYIDFGSSLDGYYREQVTRPYMMRGTKYAERNCWMIKDDSEIPEISVVMTLYKRPDVLLKQLRAIQNQSIRPKEIILFQDAIDNDIYQIQLKETIKKEFANVCICEKNQGVWGRFEYARNAKSKYVCIFDDDTIPGSRWLENCYIQMIQQEGIYGTIGIVLKNDEVYPFKNYFRVGWAAPCNENIEVDFVGHSWFIKKDYLDYMFETSEEFRGKYKYVGEDAYLSYSCKKVGINTIVPAHYVKNLDFWGSMPKMAYEYGGSTQAISNSSDNMRAMYSAISELRGKEWETIAQNNDDYVSYVYDIVEDLESNKRLCE